MDRRHDDSDPDLNPTDDARTPPVSVLGARPPAPRPADTPPAARGATPTPFYPHLPRYQILEAAGHGGMGQVVRAYDLHLKREVAIKFLLRPHDAPPGVVERFKREALILAQLDHPHVVPVFDSGEASGFLYYVMKLVPGGSLARQMPAVRTSARRAAELVRKVALAVQHVHEKGVLHRDLKPANVLVDDRGEPLVVDFGVARWDDGHTATTGYAVFGTPNYLAPEVVRGGSHAGDDRSDVWSLGVILYELLVGARPFATDRGDAELFRRVLADAPQPPADGPAPLPDADAPLEAVCLTCLAKDPANRFPSAAELANALQRWLDGKPVGVSLAAARRAATGPEAVPPRKRRWPRVAATTAALAAGVALLLAPVPWKRWDQQEKTELEREWQKPLAERLNEPGKSVEFVAADGKLLAGGAVPGFEGVNTWQPSEGGHCELATGTKCLLELGNEPLPFPVALEAEVQLIPGRGDKRLMGGVYAGRQQHPSEGPRPVHTAFLNAYAAHGGDTPSPKWRGKVPACATTVRLNPSNDPNDVYDGLQYISNARISVAADPPSNAAWAAGMGSVASGVFYSDMRVDDAVLPPHRLRVERRGDQFHAWRDDFRFNTRPSEDLIFRLRKVFRDDGRTFAEPPFADGFGLFVAYGSAQFRSVKLTRLSE